MRLALYQPDIAGNVGTILRLAACLDIGVDLIEPMGFAYADRALARAGMDYAAQARVARHADWAAFEREVAGRIVLLTTRGGTRLDAASFAADDVLLLGSESAGVPDAVHVRADVTVRIPLAAGFRSLNVAVAAGIALAEGLRQTEGFPRVIELDDEQTAARAWFEQLRDRICTAFEAIEREADSDARFDYLAWDRTDPSGEPGGGGVRGVMKGKVFEKVGVNVSTVGGSFEGDFAKTIHGAADNPRFFATGISLVAHMANPHVPAVHMNTRFLVTTRRWFGGGADLNPPLPRDEDTADFHARLKQACDAHGADYYERYRKWADDYFYIPHRQVHRGVGGIFYDHLEGDFAANFAFTQDVGRAFLDIYPALVRRRMAEPFTPEQITQRNQWRGRYAEFNLVYDRGTLFGLKTGGNVDAILMSLPPVAEWA